jgi:hypothetical protein
MLARVWEGTRESRIGCLGAKLGIEFVDLGSLQSRLGWLYRRLIFIFFVRGLGWVFSHTSFAWTGRGAIRSPYGLASAMEPLVLHYICC